MLSIRTVLCPVDFSPRTPRQVDLAAGLCRAFGARLVLHHNVVELAIGAGVGWMWATDHLDTDRDSEQKFQPLLTRLPAGVTADVSLTHGPVADAVLAAARGAGADLIVLSAHGDGTDTDAMVTERVLERATVPVLAMHTTPDDSIPLPFAAAPAGPQRLLVPIALTPAPQPAMSVAFELARQFPFEVHLLHVRPDAVDDVEDIRRRMLMLAPSDLTGRVHVRVDSGAPRRAIARAARDLAAVCIVMSAHARVGLRRWFRAGTPLGVLHLAPCPIWCVPPDATRDTCDVTFERTGLVDELQSTAFQYWPSSQVYGVVDSRSEADATLADLVQAGVTKDRLHTWYGPAGKAAFVPAGDRRLRAARLWRELEKATGERELLDRYAAEVENGGVCIGVRCGGEGRDIVTSIFHRHGGHLISYFSIGSVEHVSP